ncbi:MAG: hypothetical protein JO061_00660 [Acidobacteriaceae bacterium]|nr:hypothetical protein [Acidobacteriaceae bacterium]
MCFPLGKICKFLENGSEDSVHSFAQVIVEGDAGLGAVGNDNPPTPHLKKRTQPPQFVP